jgi:two-component system, OmpR family, response regulator QseB
MRLLLVEDDLDLGTALSQSLTVRAADGSGADARNSSVVWVRRMADAAAQLLAFDFNAVILDINLPDGEGLTLLKNLRAKKQAVPVIVMTAREALDDRLRAFNLGADDYVIKPFAVEELIARIAAVTRRAAGFAEEELIVGEICLKRSQHQVSVANEGITLAPLEFRMLEQLMLASGRVLTRASLMNIVWSAAEQPSDTALELVVHSLRKKLGVNQIKTVRGVGYMLMP